ncbi:Werner Syndrome-like exonuclease [Medicago truncatula]|uniref:Werner Syndrome-like exonuclease n=1 Tax=Medicago truncatula TaxID=3880 RepID=UPI000D2F2354|nr:Werner Syndrome-like exonuclease [Medicago truncatula]
MSITTIDYAVPNKTHNKHDVFFHSDIIHTMITNKPFMVDKWLSSIKPYENNNSFLVGLDVECLFINHSGVSPPAAVLQLYIGGECLVFQILHASFVPKSLVAFLGNENNKFVGVGIREDMDKLLRDFSLLVVNFVDLRYLAAEKLGEKAMKSAGLKTLALCVLDKEIEKPKKITLSDWGGFPLTVKQVQYACVDAFISFEVGRLLLEFDS